MIPDSRASVSLRPPSVSPLNGDANFAGSITPQHGTILQQNHRSTAACGSKGGADARHATPTTATSASSSRRETVLALPLDSDSTAWPARLDSVPRISGAKPHQCLRPSETLAA